MTKTVMIVDDSASLRQVVNITLQKAGYDVIQAGDGKDAIAKLDGKKINLIISDVNMPGMNGIDMVTTIKQMAPYKFTPIIMLTTESQDQMKAAGRAAGVKAWMVKPFNPAQMLDAVSKLILP